MSTYIRSVTEPRRYPNAGPNTDMANKIAESEGDGMNKLING